MKNCLLLLAMMLLTETKIMARPRQRQKNWRDNRHQQHQQQQQQQHQQHQQQQQQQQQLRHHDASAERSYCARPGDML